ncbi:hypothetical protein AMBR_FBHANALA_01766 [Dolosigranulum pigrum]|nr:hypothetical protein AMBR_FBHANALA_01766 [Dolosigranulum pigrum]
MSHLVDPVFLPVYLEHLVFHLVVPECYPVFRLFQELLVSHLVDPVFLPEYLEHLVFHLVVPEYYPVFRLFQELLVSHLAVPVYYLIFHLYQDFQDVLICLVQLDYH